MSEEFRRRATDGAEFADEEILELIRKSTNDDQRAQLLVSWQLQRNLIHNTNVTIQVAKRQEQHELAFQAHIKVYAKDREADRLLLAKGMTAWRVFATIGVALLAVLTWVAQDRIGVLAGEIAVNRDQEGRITRLEHDTPISREADSRLKVLEETVKRNTGIIIDLEHQFSDHERADTRTRARR